jgi:hypothetical protein
MSCQYEYDPAEPMTWHHPGSPADASLVSCKVAGVDIFPMLTREQQEEIEALILEADGGQAQADASEAHAMRRTERAMEGFLA